MFATEDNKITIIFPPHSSPFTSMSGYSVTPEYSPVQAILLVDT